MGVKHDLPKAALFRRVAELFETLSANTGATQLNSNTLSLTSQGTGTISSIFYGIYESVALTAGSGEMTGNTMNEASKTVKSTGTMYFIYEDWQVWAKILFAISLLLMMASLVITLLEIVLSAGALRVLLKDLEEQNEPRGDF